MDSRVRLLGFGKEVEWGVTAKWVQGFCRRCWLVLELCGLMGVLGTLNCALKKGLMKDLGKLEHLCLTGGNVKWFSCYGKLWHCLRKVKIQLLCGPAGPLMGVYPKQLQKVRSWIAKQRGNTGVPWQMNEWKMECNGLCVYRHTNGVSLTLKKGRKFWHMLQLGWALRTLW